MTAIVQRLRSDFSGKDAGIDVLIDRYSTLEEDCDKWRTAIYADGLTHHLESGFFFAHPLIKHLLTMERLLHITLRELMFAVRLHNWGDEETDDVETFLAELERTNRPHQSKHRGD